MVQHAAFRVVQEALSNVHRHAGAKGVEVELANRGGELTLRIADDGKGIASLGRAHLEGIPPGVGIAGMRSRVEQLDGSLDIASDRAGTVVAAWIPLPDAPPEAHLSATRCARPPSHLTQGKDARRA
jgi:signal transduction histidine kinase